METLRPSSFLIRFLVVSAIVLLVVGIWSWHSGLVFTSKSGDGFIEHLPDRVFSAQVYRSGHLPLWNPYLYCGIDQPSVIQPGVFYFLNGMYVLLPPNVAFNLLVVVHLLIAFYFTRAFLLAHNLSDYAALFGAITFALTGFASSHVGAVPLANSAVWVPAVFYFFERWLQTRQWRYCLWAGACLAFELLAGWPQMVVLTGLYLAIYAAISIPGYKPRRYLYLGFGALLIFSAFAGLVQILPTLQLKQSSNLEHLPYEYFGTDAIPPAMFLQMLFPLFFGIGRWPSTPAYWGPVDFPTMQCYLGILPLFLAVTGCLCIRTSRLARFGVLALPLSLLLAAGTHSPVGPLLYRIPVYNFFRDHMVHVLFAGFAVAVLGAVGFSSLANFRLENRRTLAAALPIGLFTAAFLVLQKSSDLIESMGKSAGEQWVAHLKQTVNFDNASLWLAFVTLLVCSLLFGWLMLRPSSKVVGTLIVGALALDLGMYWVLMQPPTSTLTPSAGDRVLLSHLPSPVSGRVYSATREHSLLHINLNQVVPYSDILGYGAFLPYPYTDLVSLTTGGYSPYLQQLALNNRVLSALNVRYLLLDQEQLKRLQQVMPVSTGAPLSTPQFLADAPDLLQNQPWDKFGPASQLQPRKIFSGSVETASGVQVEGLSLAADSLYQLTYDYRPLQPRSQGVGLAVGAPKHTRWLFFSGTAMSPRLTPFAFPIAVLEPESPAEVKFFSGGEVPIEVENVQMRLLSKLPLSGSYYQIVAQEGETYLLENQASLPRAYFPTEVHEVPHYADARAELWRMGSRKNLQTTAWVEATGVLQQSTFAPGVVREIVYTPNKVKLEANCEGTCFLVLADRYYPGWKAFIDGTPTTILPTNAVMRGIVVPGGSHEIVFRYMPAMYVIGLGTSGAAFALLFIVTWRERRYRPTS